MKQKDLLTIRLSLFDGAAGGEGSGAAAPAEGGATGETTAIPASTRRGKTGKSGEFTSVVFGKQAQPAAEEPPPAAGEAKERAVSATSDTLEARQKAFRELVNGEFKDIYTQETQRIIDRRFRETKELERQAGRNQPLIDMLLQRYGIADGSLDKLTAAIENDDAYWSEAAQEAGMGVEQYKQLQKLQRENAVLLEERRRREGQSAARQQLEQWYAQGEELKGQYPGFDLGAEVEDPQFLSMLKAGIPVRHAYEVLHMEDIKAGVAQSAARQKEKQVVDGIRAKGTRPLENGTAAQSAFTVKDDVSKLTKSERAEIARRVARGEQISF